MVWWKHYAYPSTRTKKIHNALQPATEIQIWLMVMLLTQTSTIICDIRIVHPQPLYLLQTVNMVLYYSKRNVSLLSAPMPSSEPAENLCSLSAVSDWWPISVPLCFLQTSFSISSYMFLSYSVAALPWNVEYSMVFTDFDWSVAYNGKYFFDIHCKKLNRKNEEMTHLHLYVSRT